MADSLEKVLLIILGWLLGLLGPAFVNIIKQQREDTAVRAAIFAELHSLARLLVIAAHGVRIHQANATDIHLQWMAKQMGRFSQPEDEPIKDFVEQMLSLSADQRHGLLVHGRKPGQSQGLQKYPVPLLDSRVAALYTLTTGEQIALLGIRTQLGFLDDAVDRARKFNDMTFQQHKAGNYELVIDNADRALDDYVRHAVLIVDRIADAVDARVKA
ncbi:MAG: hypothetical protein Q8R06_18520 [Polaromonas sp.]|uniref:hypothetical protein n=1 Tax=Polaromonas sp. TaxID=1869339 RepID=UPI002732CC5D|nr:hypothetical protein [Polaromonas sp.]MDP3799108.1 hypothetical protein [Polaromonas sp.]